MEVEEVKKLLNEKKFNVLKEKLKEMNSADISEILDELEDKESVQILYKHLGYTFRKLKNWSYYLITSYEDFEKEFGQEADKRRKLYNGMLKTNLYQYIGPRPPKK